MSLIYPLTLLSLASSALASTQTLPVQVPQGFFEGPQTGIGSWFRAAEGATNGKSWCGYPYYDNDPIFAVSLRAMGGHTYNSNPAAWKAATQKYCGLEASVKDPKTGKEILVYMGDAFDDQYVRSPGSIDIMYDAFSKVHGNPNSVHEEVIKGAQWKLTGRVNTKYAAPGAKWPVNGGGEPSDPKPSNSTPAPKPSTPAPAPTPTTLQTSVLPQSTGYPSNGTGYPSNGTEYSTTASDYPSGGSDHPSSDGDHPSSGSDYTSKGNDYTSKGNDYTSKGNDHPSKGNDYTSKGNDHPSSDEDHPSSDEDYQSSGGDYASTDSDSEDAEYRL